MTELGLRARLGNRAGGRPALARGLGKSLLCIGAASTILTSCGGTLDEDGPGSALDFELPPPEVGDTVAMVETEQPAIDDFLLRATIPVPPGLFTGDPGTSLSLGVIDWDGTARTGQVEIVSRYADDADGADVIEFIGPVTRDPAIATGDPSQYEIVVVDQPIIAAPDVADLSLLQTSGSYVPASVSSLLQTPGAFVLESRDVFGNRYSLDLLDENQVTAEWRRFGVRQVELKLSGAMAPDPGSSSPLPRMFGVQAYLRASAGEEVLALDIRFENGGDNSNTTSPLDDPVGKFYFDALHLRLPNGWVVEQAFDDPTFGTPFADGGMTVHPLIEEQGGGILHVIPSNSQFHRRLRIAPAAQAARAQALAEEAGRGFVVEALDPVDSTPLWSWWNTDTGRFFVQRMTLPDFSYTENQFQTWIDNNFAEALGHINNGTGAGDFPVASDAYGWAHPYFLSNGMSTGGTGIYFYEGVRTAVTKSVDGYRHIQLMHRMNTERQANAYYGLDGEPTRIEDWFVENNPGGLPYINLEMRMTLQPAGNDPMGYDSVDTTQVDAVATAGRAPAYEAGLLNYTIYTHSHLIRYTKNLEPLVWLGNDSIAKDDMRMQAELARMTYIEHPTTPGGYLNFSGLGKDREHLDLYGNGIGFRFGRAEGHMIDVVTMYYSVADLDWRAARRAYFDEIVDLVNDGQGACNGFYQSNISSKFISGLYKGRNNIEQAIADQALMAVGKSVYEGVNAGQVALIADILTASAYAMISPMAWSAGENRPWNKTAVGPPDYAATPFCNITLASDQHETGYEGTLVWGTLGIGYGLTGDPQFLSRAALVGGGGPTLDEIEDAAVDNPWSVTYLLGLAQPNL